MQIFVVNALPASVLVGADKGGGAIQIAPLLVPEAATLATSMAALSAVGHLDTAAIFSSTLGIEIPMNRLSVPPLQAEGRVGLINGPGVALLAGLYNGPRLPEGATVLPEGAEINFYLVGRPSQVRALQAHLVARMAQ